MFLIVIQKEMKDHIFISLLVYKALVNNKLLANPQGYR